jgi:hypothetical protein
MKTLITALCAVFIAAAAHAQSASEQKPGLWESRTTKMTVNGKDMLETMRASFRQMRAMMDKMPPEQRKQMQASMGAQGSDPTVRRVCVSAAMLKNQEAMARSDLKQADCAPPKVSHDGSRMSFETSCKMGDGGTAVSKGVVVNGKDTITTSVETVVNTGGERQVMQTEASMTFIGSDCGGLQPIDEMARQAQAGRGAAPARK